MKCLKCEKELTRLDPGERNVNGGGELRVSFGYGSTHDMMTDLFEVPRNSHEVLPEAPRHDRLLGCELVNAYICDSCFVKHAELFEGFKITVTPKLITKVV